MNKDVTTNSISIRSSEIVENLILEIRGTQVLLDRDLATLYGVETKVLNQAAKRKSDRFPENFRFQLTDMETLELVTNCDRFSQLKHSSVNPYVFTEQGVAMLATTLHSKIAIAVSIQIMNAFVAMRHFITSNNYLFQRIETLEHGHLELIKHQSLTDLRLNNIFNRLDQERNVPAEGLFFDGQIFDAYVLMAKLIKSAKKDIKLIDNYIDESVLVLLDKRTDNVAATIFTQNKSPQLQLDIQRHNAQYSPIEVKQLAGVHDRFLLIDDNQLYHIGASIKDLGKKLFAITLIEDSEIIAAIRKMIK